MADGKGGKDAAKRPPKLDPSPSGISAVIGMILLGAILYAIVQAI